MKKYDGTLADDDTNDYKMDCYDKNNDLIYTIRVFRERKLIEIGAYSSDRSYSEKVYKYRL